MKLIIDISEGIYKHVGTIQNGSIEAKQIINSVKNGISAYKVISSAEPKTGHWILQPSNKEQGERDFIWWKCSECGQVIFSETERDRKEFHAFCGRCGARMVEPQESEDI